MQITFIKSAHSLQAKEMAAVWLQLFEEQARGAWRQLKYKATCSEKWHRLPSASCLNLGTKGRQTEELT